MPHLRATTSTSIPGVAREADELDHLGLGEAVLVGPGGDPGVDVDAVGGVEVLALGDAQEGVDLRVVGDDDGALGAAGDPPDDGLAAPHEDLRDGAGLGRAAEAAPRPRLLDAHEDEVAVEGRARARPGRWGGRGRPARPRGARPSPRRGRRCGRPSRFVYSMRESFSPRVRTTRPLRSRASTSARRASRAASSGEGPRSSFASSRKERMRRPRGERAARTRFSGVSVV